MRSLVELDDFPAAADYTYLNAASVALMPRPVGQAVLEWQEELAIRGTVRFDEEAETQVFEELRRAAARLLGARPYEVAASSSATEALCSLAWALSPGEGQNVVSADIEFPSVVYPWLRVSHETGCEVRLAKGHDGSVDLEEIICLIDDHTGVVCLSHVEYGSGQRLDMAALARVAHDHGSLLIVDASQSAGALPIDVEAWGVDALVTASYKWLCGPFGAAVLYLRPELYQRLEPGLVGWRSTAVPYDFQAQEINWASTARRFEFSTMAYGAAIGMAKAIDYLLEIGIEAIWAHNLSLADRLLEGLESLGAQILSPLEADERTSIITARFPDHDQAEVARRLTEARVIISHRMGSVRFSPHLYNTEEDIERTLEVLDKALATLRERGCQH